MEELINKLLLALLFPGLLFLLVLIVTGGRK